MFLVCFNSRSAAVKSCFTCDRTVLFAIFPWLVLHGPAVSIDLAATVATPISSPFEPSLLYAV